MKIQLKRSNVLESGYAKQPTAGQMEYGELAVNYNADDPCIFIKDSGNNIIRISNLGIPLPGDENPQSGTLDDRYIMKIGDTMNGVLKLVNSTPVADLDAASKGYVDQKFVDVDIPAATEPSPFPPASPDNGQLWWNTNDGRLYIWYEDGNSDQWVPATPENGGGIGDDWSNIPNLPA